MPLDKALGQGIKTLHLGNTALHIALVPVTSGAQKNVARKFKLLAFQRFGATNSAFYYCFGRVSKNQTTLKKCKLLAFQ